MSTINAHLVDQPAPEPQYQVQLHIDNMPSGGGAPADGSVTAAKLAADAVETAKIKDGAVAAVKLEAGLLPVNATAQKAGLVKKATTVANVASADATAAAAETVTKAEFDKLVAVANETKKQLNAALAALKAAGIMA